MARRVSDKIAVPIHPFNPAQRLNGGMTLRIFLIATVLAAISPLSASAQTQEPAATGTIRGTVVADDGTPLDKIAVRVVETAQVAKTGPDGRFELTDVPAGTHEILVSAVDLIRVRRTVTVTAGGVVDVTIKLSESTGAYSERVGVTASDVTRAETPVAAQQTLDRQDIQHLRGLMTNDPFRAIQALPGVSSTDDLRSEFVVRGLAADHMAFTFEGIATPFLVHTVYGLEDGGSVAMVNSDVLSGITLSHGSYPQLFGDRVGAELDFAMREGSREEINGHVAVSMTDASAVAEGPIGRSKQGSWLLSFRQSYLERLLRAIYPDNDFGFGFSDAKAKVVYDLNARHQVQFALTAGHSLFQQQPSRIGFDDIKEGHNALAIAVGSWRYAASPRFVLTQRIGFAAHTFDNVSRDNVALTHGRSVDGIYRAEWTSEVTKAMTLQGGGEVRHSTANGFGQDPVTATQVRIYENVDASGVATSGYVLANLHAGKTSLTPGLRVDHWSLSHSTTASPWLLGQLPLASWITIRGGAGGYHQEPGAAALVGLRGDASLRPERAYHADAGVEVRTRGSLVAQVNLFNREDRDLIRLPGGLRLVNGRPAAPPASAPYRNALDGHARGVEFLLERRNPNGLSGWISYDYAVARYRDTVSGETFWSDYDQRHTVNAYAMYRRSERMSFSARFRTGSNFPAPGYYTSRDGAIFLGERKNEVRTPTYARLDLRANRTFDWGSRRLSLFAEVINVTSHENVRAVPPSITGQQFRVLNLFEGMFPLLPSVGILIDF